MRKVRVNITKYVSTEAGPRYCPAVITSNGRIKQDVVLVGGKEERHPEGAYYLDWRDNGVRARLSVGKTHRTRSPNVIGRHSRLTQPAMASSCKANTTTVPPITH